MALAVHRPFATESAYNSFSSEKALQPRAAGFAQFKLQCFIKGDDMPSIDDVLTIHID